VVSKSSTTGGEQDRGRLRDTASRHVYVYEPPRPLEGIAADIKTLEGEILALKEVTA
jgi:hypothetical protein